MDQGGGHEAAGYYVGVLLHLEGYEDVLEIPEYRFFGSIFRGNREESLEAADNISSEFPLFSRFWSQYTYAVCGDRERAIRGWTELQEGEDDLPFWIDWPLRLFLEQAKPEEILKEAGTSNQHLATAHLVVGMDYLANGQRADAERHFRQSVECNSVMWNTHHWAEAYLERIAGDENWPESLKPLAD